MIVIRDYKNNEYPLLAVKTVNEELNGNHDIELKVPQQRNNNLDLKEIDKLWEINYKTVDYKIMYIKQITKGDSFYLDVRAIPLFYWDFDKLIVHENKDGHYTGTNAFTDLFNGTGYQYVLVDFVEAIQIEGYGKGETRLEMFKRLIERFGLEFYIVGKTVYLKKLIGNDTNFQYRYKLNASNVSKSIDASNYFTHIKGFGNFEEGSENYLKDAKLKREYTSPLASVLGKYEGKPIVDGRIKDTATMDANLKKAVEESLEISIEGNLHDVRSIYAEAVPTIGDRVFLIDERIGLEQEIRIHTLKRTYDVHDKLIDCEVTFGSQNIRDRYKSNLNSAAKDFTALMKGEIKLPTWSLDEIARGMITKIHASENELKYGSFGIQAIDKNNPNNVFGLNSQGWYISTDGGRTARTIATAEGILAESIIGNHLIGLQLTSPGETGYFYVAGNNAEFVNVSNNTKLRLSPTGLYGMEGNNTVFRLDKTLLTSSAVATNEANVYLAARNGYEGRMVVYDDIPGDGLVDSYRYLPFRALGIYSNFVNVNAAAGGHHLYLRALSNAEVRVTLSGTTDVYQNIRTAGVFTNHITNNTQSTNTNNFYIYTGAGGQVHVMQTGTTDVWLPIKADTFNQASSVKLKTNIEDLGDVGLSIINSLHVKKYDMKTDVKKGITDKKKVGFLAEYSESIANKEKDAIDLYKVTSYSVKAIQELSTELNTLKEQINGE